MTDSITVSQRQYATAGAPRLSPMSASSTGWSIGALITPKPCTHLATEEFGVNATLHPRPEEIPL